MPSPFPGMNPYLENDDAWENFHHDFIAQSQRLLNPQVGDDYLVKIEARIYIRELGEEERFLDRADGLVADTRRSAPLEQSTLALATAPIQLTLPTVDIVREAYLEIQDRRHRRVVTVIELLSPTNKKSGLDHEAYLNKRRSLLASQVNFVEIDLRRGGERPEPPRLPECDYYALVCWWASRPQVGVWPIPLRERLPIIPIPLRSPDADIHLDLQEVLHQVYDGVRFGKYIYGDTPQPPLLPDDAAWAQQFVPQAGVAFTAPLQ